MAERLKRWDGVQWVEVATVNRVEVFKKDGGGILSDPGYSYFSTSNYIHVIDGLSQSYEYVLV